MNPVQESAPTIAIRNEPADFGKVYDLYYRTIFNYVYKRLLDYELARDIAAETFLKAYLHLDRFNPQAKPIIAWLYRIALNEIRQYYRRQKYRPLSLNELIETNRIQVFDERAASIEKSELEAEMGRHEDFINLSRQIGKLPLVYQQVLSLKYFEGKSVKEMAEILDKKEGTIKSLTFRGLELLRKLIGN